jgi:hypothetical protein
LRYYRGRAAWLVEPDQTPAKISPYPETEPASGAEFAGGKLNQKSASGVEK